MSSATLSFHYLVHIKYVTILPFNHQCIVYYAMAQAVVLPNGTKSLLLLAFTNVTQFSYVRVNSQWCLFHKAALLGNHVLCIAVSSFTFLTWPCPLDKGLWWAVKEYQFCKQIFLQVKFSTLTHQIDVQTQL